MYRFIHTYIRTPVKPRNERVFVPPAPGHPLFRLFVDSEKRLCVGLLNLWYICIPSKQTHCVQLFTPGYLRSGSCQMIQPKTNSIVSRNHNLSTNEWSSDNYNYGLEDSKQHESAYYSWYRIDGKDILVQSDFLQSDVFSPIFTTIGIYKMLNILFTLHTVCIVVLS